MNNFSILDKEWPLLAKLAQSAENYIYTDANACLFKLGAFAEQIVSYMFDSSGLDIGERDNTIANKTRLLKNESLIPQNIDNVLFSLRTNRNKAVHDGYDDKTECKMLLGLAYKLAVWFANTYGAGCTEVAYILPEEKPNLDDIINEQNKLIKELELKLASVEKSTISINERRIQSDKYARNLSLSESEARVIIDAQLRRRDWIVDSVSIRYSKGSRPQKGKNMIISEWPTNSEFLSKGYSDYAFFIGEKLVAIADAKKPSELLPSVLAVQCKDYARNIRQEDSKYLCGEWSNTKVPFIFAANGRPYLKNAATMSGIWYLDMRQSDNMPTHIAEWFSPQDLLDKLKNNIADTNVALEDQNCDYLIDKYGLNLRKYQVKAIDKVTEAIIEGKREMLLAMATGTGKTRTTLGIIYKMIKSGRFNRVLFLVDRLTLGTQAAETFKDVALEKGLTLDALYKLNDLDTNDTIEADTKLSVCTVQSLVSKVVTSDIPKFSPGTFDLIIVDEAHRGYILDKDMTDDEILYRDQADFASKYNSVLQYFDAVKIALTATPAAHTTEIFGDPIYTYSYREAVIDGYLVDFDPPYNINTAFNTKGATISKEDEIAIYDPETGDMINGAHLPDEMTFEVENFNRQIVLPHHTKTILENLAKHLDPGSKEKTLIFAVDDKHADMIVKDLKDIFSEYGIDDDAIMKITGKTASGNKKKIQGVIKNLKNNDNPNIAVTVDLLSTGIDVPEICNIVFMRKTKSRILFEQMIGRATRLCPAISKTHFNIFDAVNVYESLEPVTNMKTTVTKDKKSMSDLITELTFDNETSKTKLLDSVIAKLQRKVRALSDDQKIDIENSRGVNINDYVDNMRILTTTDKVAKCIDDVDLLIYIDSYKPKKKGYLQSEKEDTFIDITRGYGKNSEKPADYIESFTQYVKDNKDTIEAIKIACTKPSLLTKAMIRELRIKLDSESYSVANLNQAYSAITNQEIIADIITYIRKAVLDTPIYNHADRVKSAINKLIANNDFNAMQKNVVKNIETYLLHESVLNEDIFNEGEFKHSGGFKTFNKRFSGNLIEIIKEINTYIFESKEVA